MSLTSFSLILAMVGVIVFASGAIVVLSCLVLSGLEYLTDYFFPKDD